MTRWRIVGTLMAAALLIATAGQVQGELITFDDLTTRNNFYALDIEDSYQGFEWGYSYTPGLPGAVIPTTADSGWASATVANSAVYPAPTPVSGNSYAWNWNGPQSLYIDFQTPHDVNSAYFATLSSAYGGGNATSIQMYGYDEANNLVATSGLLVLTHSFQKLDAGFTSVRTLEIRANANRWFSIDNLDVAASSVPEPTSLAMFAGLGVMGMIAARRRKRVA